MGFWLCIQIKGGKGATAKTHGKLENLLRKLKEHEGNYKLKPDNSILHEEGGKNPAFVYTQYFLRSLKPLILLWHENV